MAAPTTQKYYETLFDLKTESTVFGSQYSNRPQLANTFAEAEGEFVVLNPIHQTIDLETTHEKYRPDLGRRADVNCTAYRNLLCEIDKDLSVEQQLALFKRLKLPYSTLTYSGGKSLHAVICLSESVDLALYYTLFNALRSVIPNLDKSCKNPSRLTRRPNCTRENGVEQSLIDVRKRISLDQLYSWLQANGASFEETARPKERAATVGDSEQAGATLLSVNSWHFIETGECKSSRHNRLMALAYELTENGFSDERIEELMFKAAESCGLLSERQDAEREVYRIIQHAAKTAAVI